MPPLGRTVPYLYEQPEYAGHLKVAALAGASAATLEPRLAVGVIRCFYRASPISYVAASASYRRSEMSRGAYNTLSSASSFSVFLPVGRTIFTTVVPGVVEGRAPRRVVPHAVPVGTLA